MASKQLTIKEKKALAYDLFTRGQYSQKEIAAKVLVSEVTISKWVNDNKWEKIQQSAANLKDTNEYELLKQINAFNKHINERVDGEGNKIGFGTSSEYDALSKLTKAYKELENKTSIGKIIDVSILYLNWLREQNVEEAQKQALMFDEFIKLQTSLQHE
jgi:uncharacterized protein YjcR